LGASFAVRLPGAAAGGRRRREARVLRGRLAHPPSVLAALLAQMFYGVWNWEEERRSWVDMS
jgi:hypothetical protein